MTFNDLGDVSTYISDFDRLERDRKWRIIINNIQNFKSLSDDWDGEGSGSPSNELVDQLVMLLKASKDNIEVPSRALVTHDGDIIVEWQYVDCTLELETSSPGSFDFMITPDDGEPEFFHILSNPAIFVGNTTYGFIDENRVSYTSVPSYDNIRHQAVA